MLYRTIVGRLSVGCVAAIVVSSGSALLPSTGAALTAAQIIEGAAFIFPDSDAVNAASNAYVAGGNSDDVFQTAPGGLTTATIEAGSGQLNGHAGVVVDTPCCSWCTR